MKISKFAKVRVSQFFQEMATLRYLRLTRIEDYRSRRDRKDSRSLGKRAFQFFVEGGGGGGIWRSR